MKVMPTVFFSLAYAQTLEAVLPIIEEARKTYDVFVLNSVRSDVDDRDLAREVLEPRRIPYVHEYETRDSESSVPKWVRHLSDLDQRTRRFTGGFVAGIVSLYAQECRRRMVVRHWLDAVAPAAVVTTGDQTLLQKHLVEEANARAIPTINFQWTIANASVRHTTELVERFAARDKRLPRRVRWKKAIQSRLSTALLKVKGLHVRFRSSEFGAGNAKVFGVIGRGCFDNYVALGVPSEAMVITGHPTYEALYRDADRLVEDVTARVTAFERLGLSRERNLILWCTNDQRTYFEGFVSFQEMFDSWRRKVRILLDLGDDYEIVLKLHPKEHVEDYRPLESLSSRVHVIKGGDVRELLSHCSLMVTRFSSTAVAALCLRRPVVTYNYPPMPGGTLFEDVGGTIHAKSDQEFRDAVVGILVDRRLIDLLRDRREDFLSRYLDFRDEPAARRFVRLIDKMISSGARGNS